MKLKRFLAFAISLAMVLSIVPAFSLTVGAAAYANGGTLTYDGVTYDVKSDNLIYNGDFSVTSTGDDGYTYVDAWTAGYANNTLQAMSTNPNTSFNFWSVNSMPFTYTEASDDTSAYITTPVRNMTQTYNNFPYSPDDAAGFATINNWFKDSSGNYITAEAGKTYYMTFKVKTSSTGSANNWVSMGAFSGAPSNYTSARPGRFDVSSFVDTSVLDTWIKPAVYTSAAETWVTVEAVGTASAAGYFAFQNTWAVDYGTHSFTDFEIYEIEAQSSNATTIKNALNALSVDSMTKGTNLTLASTATDVLNTTVDVTWTSSNTDVISSTGVVTAPENFTEVTLTPSATFDGATVTGDTRTVAVFPATYATGDMYGYYQIDNQVDTSNVSWYHRQTTDGSVGVDGLTTTTTNGVKYYTFPALGGVGGTNARTSIAITPGETYYVRFFYGGTALGNGDGNMYNKVYTTAGQYNDEVAFDFVSGTATTGITTTANVWTPIEAVFTASEGANFLTFVYSWLDAGLIIADVELYNVTDLSKTVTLNILDSDGNTIKTLSEKCLSGEDVTFAAQSFASSGIFYSTEETTYTNITADVTYEIYATVDSSKYAATESYTWNYASSADISTTLSKGNISGLSDTLMTVNWGDQRNGIVNFNVPVTSGKQLASATLTLRLGGQQGNDIGFNVYAMPTSKSPKVAASPDSSAGILVGSYSGSFSGEAQDATLTVDLTFSDYVDTSAGLTLRLAATSQMALMYGAGQGERAPVLSNVTWGDITATAVTVNCVDESGNTLQTGTQYFTEFYGYDDELIYPGTEVPTIDGYIFKSKSVATGVITLTYAEDTQDDYFFDNITDMDTRFVSLNMLGSHDAFTAGVDENRYDAAGVAQGNEGAKNASLTLGGSFSTNMSVSQDLTALGQLQAGARYFDTRLSRSETDADAGTLYNNAPHTNGVLYTTHGLLFGEFEPELNAIAQWAAVHPGEIIVLDFQEYFDYNSGYDGNATAQSWRDLHSLLSKTGILEYVTIGNQSIKDVTYGQLTENGTKCGIVLFGRAVATNAGVGNFILRGDTSGAFNGKVYSNYETGLSTTIGSSFSTSYVQAQADYLDQFGSGDHPIYWMFRVMQAQSESSNLLNQASSDNTSIYSALQSNPEWLTELPVVMVNRVGTNTDNIVTLLKSCNVPTVTVNYVNNGTTVYSEVGGLVGTLYTNDGFYNTPVYKLVNDANGEYYVSETFYTNHNSNTITPVIYGSTVEVDVTALGNVYSTRYANDASLTHIVYNGTLSDGQSYTGVDNFAAYTWGTQKDRLGIAILSADADASAYMLKAIENRSSFNNDASAINFYAVPVATYRALDLTDGSQLVNLLTEDNLVYSNVWGWGGERGQGNSNEVTYVLDSEKIKSIAAQGDVVIIGDAHYGLYGLLGEGMAIVSGWLVTTDGAETVVADGGTYTLPSTAIVYLETNTDALYAPSAVPTVTSDMTFTGYTDTGLTMVQGAQVRIGEGVDGDGKVKQLTEDEINQGLISSGLRFITYQNNTDTVAGLDGVTVGVVVTAEDGTTAVEIPATKWQNDDNSVFTTALTNLAESNYIRKFKAYPYVSYTDVLGNEGGAVVSDSFVERSIYQVAAGLLAKSYTADDNGTGYDKSTAEGGTDYAVMPEVLVKVLNAYVNQTGIRLTMGGTAGEGATFEARVDGADTDVSGAYGYGDNIFFEVSGVTATADGDYYSYEITLKPNSEFENTPEIKTWWYNYIRINNNKTKVQGWITYDEATGGLNEDGSITFNFRPEIDSNKVTQ